MAQTPHENACSECSTPEMSRSEVKRPKRTLPADTPAKAFELREQGYQYQQIANLLGISIGAAHKYVKSEDTRRDEAQRRRVLAQCEESLKILEDLEPIYLEMGQRGNLEAQKAVKKSLRIRSQLLKTRAEVLFASETAVD